MTSTTNNPSLAARLTKAENEVKRRRLRDMKLLAVACLIFFAIVYVISVMLQDQYPWLEYLAAFSEAAMVGALADWYAVVVLFRHPLGIKLPHTAIIPKNKDRIADNLGDFVQGEFFSTDRIISVIRNVDPATRVAEWLSNKENAAKSGSMATRFFAYALNALDDQHVRSYLKAAVSDKIRTLDLASLLGRVLDILTRSNKHQELLDKLIAYLAEYLQNPAVRDKFNSMVAKDLPLYFDSLKGKAGTALGERVITAAAKLLVEINETPGHPARIELDLKFKRLIEKLQTDPAFRYQLGQFQDQIANHPELSAYLDGLWQDFRAWIHQDLGSKDSQIQGAITQQALHFGESLKRDQNIREWINEQLIQYAPGLIDIYRPKLGRFISDKMKEWKDEEIVEKLELNIGRDLQFIRINGAVVGGIVGIIIHVLTGWLVS